MKRIIILSAALSLLFPAAVRALTISSAAEAVEIALANSEEMRAAANAVDRAALDRAVARTAYLPNFEGSVTGGWRLPDTKEPDMGMTLSMKGVYMAGISVTQPIFAGGKIVAANRLAAIGGKVAAEELRRTRIDVAANAETTYWNYVAVLAKADMMRSYVALVDTAYAQTLSAVNAGMATRTDLLRIEARRSQVAYQHEQVTAGTDLCRMALCTALGLDLSTPLTVGAGDLQLIVTPELNDYDLQLRPEMQLLRAAIEAKEQQVRMTRADFLPRAGLQAGWSAYGGLNLDMMTQGPDGQFHPLRNKISGNGWTVMLSLQVPLFHWGEGVKKVRKARLEVENARLDLEHTSRLLELQVQQAITNVRTGSELVRSASKAAALADASLAATTESYNLGLASITELLDAQSQWHTSRASLIEAYAGLHISLTDYRAATATL